MVNLMLCVFYKSSPTEFQFSMSGWDLRIPTSNKLPSNTAAAAPVLNPKCTVSLPECPNQETKNTREGGRGGRMWGAGEMYLDTECF